VLFQQCLVDVFGFFLKTFLFKQPLVPPPPPPWRFFIFFQLLLNIGFHQITLGQSDSAPIGAPSIHWLPKLVVDEPEPPPCPARAPTGAPSIHGCLNTGFHRITLGQSDSAPTGAPSIHWMPEHRFPSDHTGPEWFSTHRRTIHPLDAWTLVFIKSHWARMIQHPPAHHPSTGCLNLLWMNLNLPRAQPAHASPPSQTDQVN